MENKALKQWQAPALEVLDVNMTMHGAGGVIIDKNKCDAKHPDDIIDVGCLAAS
ncbi:paeninodin family lasso peptide [Paenibacillus kobensis]|uniref:paeninodin family lasso peptide n=1 Tax=Paenibacillus kobensis TaxID=59841 RepID=UPI000FD8C4F7|nr:paeninodin family lasso peptide [Paenibacillus kobensis]